MPSVNAEMDGEAQVAKFVVVLENIKQIEWSLQSVPNCTANHPVNTAKNKYLLIVKFSFRS